jgi:hypothetical protein
MKNIFSAILMLLFLAVVHISSWAQLPKPLANPNLNIQRAGDVAGLGVQDDGKIIVAGEFTEIQSDTSKVNLARLNADGSLDTSFAMSVNGAISGLIRRGGFIYAWGSFTNIGGLARSGLARLSAITGSIDPAWNPPIAPSSSAYGGTIYDIVVDGAGNVFLYGYLLNVGTVLNASLVKLSPATGDAVANWVPTFPTAISIFGIAAGSNSLYISGPTQTATLSQNIRIFKMDSNTGTVDAAFAPNLTLIDIPVSAMIVAPTGDLFVASVPKAFYPGYTFYLNDPRATYTAPNGLIRLNGATGQLAPGWNPPANAGAITSLAISAEGLYSLNIKGNGSLNGINDFGVEKYSLTTGAADSGWAAAGIQAGEYVIGAALETTASGIFYAGDFAYYNNIRRLSVVKLNTTDGAVLPFNTEILQPGLVTQFSSFPDGRVVASGTIHKINGQRFDNIFRLNADNTLDAAWRPEVIGVPLSTRVMNGDLYVSGSFRFAGGLKRDGLAKFSGVTGSADAVWTPATPTGFVRSFATDGNSIFVGGDFTAIGSASRYCLAKLSGATGALDTTWNPDVMQYIVGSTSYDCVRQNSLEIVGNYLYPAITSNSRIVVNGIQRRFGRINISTGVVDAAFDPNPAQSYRVIATDGASIYAASPAVRGSAPSPARITKFNAAVGAIDPAFVALPLDSVIGSAPYSLTAGSAGIYVSYTSSSVVSNQSQYDIESSRHDPVTGLRNQSWQASTSHKSFGPFLGAMHSVGNKIYFASAGKVNGVTRSGVAVLPATSSAGDVSSDGKSDLIFRNSATGSITASLQNGSAALSSATLTPGFGFDVTHTADFNGDGKADILLRGDDGSTIIFLMDGLNVIDTRNLIGVDPNWTITHVGDFDGDGKADILWRNTNGAVTLWLMDGVTTISRVGLLGPNPDWSVSHVADFNGDGKADILWRNTNGAVTMWLMDGTTDTSRIGLLGANPDWRVSHVADFDADGKSDILWRNIGGAVTTWLMNGTAVKNAVGLLGNNPDWSVSHVGDFDGDGKADLLWRKTDGAVTMWLMNGTSVANAAGLLGADPNWRITHLGDYNGDGKADLLWRNSVGGNITMWLMNGATVVSREGLTGSSPLVVVPPMP